MAVRTRWYVLGAVIGVPAIAALIWFVDRVKDNQMRTQRGSANTAFVTGKLLVLVDWIGGGSYTRVTSVDIATGEPTVRWWRSPAESCEPRDHGMLYCSVEGGVLLDAATLDERGRSGEHGSPMPHSCDTHRSAGGAHTNRAGEVTFGEPVAESATPIVSVAVPGVQDLLGATPEGVFAYAKINGKYALSYVLATGKLAWTVPVSGGCDAFAVVGDTAVLASHDWPDRALAIDVATGAVRWRVP